MSQKMKTLLSVENTNLWTSSSEALLEDDENFEQWKTGMQKISRISDGISNEFRPRLWLTLAECSLRRKHIVLDMAILDKKLISTESKLETQISFDLHRTGSTFITHENRQSLKRILMRFACLNLRIGYCQGLNILAAIILQVMNGSERDAFKVFVYLIENILSKDFFGPQLTGLTLDMAVFRHMFNIKLPQLSLHLDRLQYESEYDQQLGAHLEPPLVNVFTMQWFITLFSNCFSEQTTLRIWDLIMLDGNETLLRTALALWDHFSDRIMVMRSADEFYTGMAKLSHEVLYFDIDQTERLINIICQMEPYPFPHFKQLREQYSHQSKNDSSISKLKKSLLQLFSRMTFIGQSSCRDNDDFEEQLALATFCVNDSPSSSMIQVDNKANIDCKKDYHHSLLHLSSLSTYHESQNHESSISAIDQLIRHFHLNSLSYHNDESKSNPSLSVLKRQYIKFKQRQKQAQTILFNLNSNMKNSADLSLKGLKKKSRLCRRSNTITSFLSGTINEATKIVKRDFSKLSQAQKMRSQNFTENVFKPNSLFQNNSQNFQQQQQQQQQQNNSLNNSISVLNRNIRFTIGSDSSTSTELCDTSSIISNSSQDEMFVDEENVQFFIQTASYSNRQLSYSLDDLSNLDIHDDKPSFYKVNELSSHVKQISLDND